MHLSSSLIDFVAFHSLYKQENLYMICPNLDFLWHVIQLKNTIKDEIAALHWCSKPIWYLLVSDSKSYLKTLCFIISHDLYVITFWINIFRENKINCYFLLNFPCLRFLRINYDVFQVRLNFTKIFFDWQGIISITITAFIFNVIVVPKITYSYWFEIKFLLKEG